MQDKEEKYRALPYHSLSTSRCGPICLSYLPYLRDWPSREVQDRAQGRNVNPKRLDREVDKKQPIRDYLGKSSGLITAPYMASGSSLRIGRAVLRVRVRGDCHPGNPRALETLKGDSGRSDRVQ